MKPIVLWTSLIIAAICTSATTTLRAESPQAFLDADSITWKSNAFAVARWKTLVGGIEGGQLAAEDVQFGLWELAPGAIYHGHHHPAPEIYYILEGQARWQVGDQTRVVTSGTTIHTRPGEVHRMENLTDTPVRAIWFWWAPGGDTEVFKAPYVFTEPAPTQPPEAVFEDPAERLH